LAVMIVDRFALVLVLGFILCLGLPLYLLRHQSLPHLKFTMLSAFKQAPSWRMRLAFLPRILLWLSLIFFLIAFINPHHFERKPRVGDEREPKNPLPSEGSAIFLVLDNSGSMIRTIDTLDVYGAPTERTKMSLLKDVTKKFVEGDPKKGVPGRSNDIIGLVSFARSAQVLAPLTHDHSEIIRELDRLDVNRDPSQYGTAISYAIYKTVNLIAATRYFGQQQVKEGKPSYEINDSIIVLVTDGIPETHPDDVENPLRSIDLAKATQYAIDNDVKLYIINIESGIDSEEFKPFRDLFTSVAEATGGRFFMRAEGFPLEKIYEEIDRLEKSTVPIQGAFEKEKRPDFYRKVYDYPIFIGLGMTTLLLGIILMTTLLRRVP